MFRKKEAWVVTVVLALTITFGMSYIRDSDLDVRQSYEVRRVIDQFLAHSQTSDNINYDLHFKRCQNVECTSATDTTIESGSQYGMSGISIIKNSNGMPFISI